MFRRLATIALALSLSTQAFASGFAAPPASQPDDDVSFDMPRRSPDLAPAARVKLKQVLAHRRARNLAAFAAYAKAGIYPHNLDLLGAAYVWTDVDGHRCAAATMIWKSGARSLVRRTAADHNDVRLAEVTEGPLLDWMLSSGLTITEIDAIQQPFMRPEPEALSRKQIDAALAATYQSVLTDLRSNGDASIDAAIDALIGRPDLIATLITSR